MQRRKDAKHCRVSMDFLCVFAPLREENFPVDLCFATTYDARHSDQLFPLVVDFPCSSRVSKQNKLAGRLVQAQTFWLLPKPQQ